MCSTGLSASRCEGLVGGSDASLVILKLSAKPDSFKPVQNKLYFSKDQLIARNSAYLT